MNKLKFVLLITLVIMLSACFPSNPSNKTEVLLQGRTMGTTYNIKVVATKEQLIELKLQQQIDAALKQVNQEMSTYIKTSEISLFNNSTSTEPVEVSSGFARVLKESIRLGQLSEGKLKGRSVRVRRLRG